MHVLFISFADAKIMIEFQLDGTNEATETESCTIGRLKYGDTRYCHAARSRLEQTY